MPHAALRQLRLTPAGPQVVYRDTIAATATASDGYLVYSSTMALHVLRTKDYGLETMIAAHEKCITSICCSPVEPRTRVCSCSQDGFGQIFDFAASESPLHKVKFDSKPLLSDWAPAGDKIAFSLENKDIVMWEFPLKDVTQKLFTVDKNVDIKVLRWSPASSQGVGMTKLLGGMDDGSLLIYDLGSPMKPSKLVGKSKSSKDAVADAHWYSPDPSFILVAWEDGSMSLLNSTDGSELIVYEKQQHVVKSIAWALGVSGDFVTSTEKVGVLKVWNASQPKPKYQIKVGTSGINCIKAVPGSAFNQLFVSFKNSSWAVCDIDAKTLLHTSPPGHSETIFDIVFHPEDPNLFATASYDGYVKVWSITTSECVREMYAGKDQLLYGLSYGPKGKHICAVTSTGTLFIWKTETGEAIHRVDVSANKQQLFRAEWNTKGGVEGKGQIITGGNDGVCYVVDAEKGAVTRRITHPGPVIGCAWHCFQPDIVATGCEDARVRIYNLQGPSQANGEPQLQGDLQGHKLKVFNVVFHPICPGLLASGSNDKTINVWNWQRPGSPPKQLAGHENVVRALLWHSELPEILLSGSWDASIRVWNVSTAQLLYVSHDHHADVYGLALHPKRPFFLVSSSRDTTVRFWIFEDKVRALLLQAVVRPDQSGEILGSSVEEAQELIMTGGYPRANAHTQLYGEASRRLVGEVQALLAASEGGRPTLQVYQKIVGFFLYRQGIEDLWGLLATCRGEHLRQTGVDAARTMFHERDLIQAQRSKALEMAAKSQIGVGLKQEERYIKAAQIMLRIGDLRNYCDMMKKAGHWERAICIAPAVSHQFWVQMCNEYIESIGNAVSDIEEVAPFWVATGKARLFIDSCVNRGDLDTAFMVAKAEEAGQLPGELAGDANSAASNAPAGASGAKQKLEDVATMIAMKYADEGNTLKAAMCFLAVSAGARAAASLSRCHEIILAYVVALLVDVPREPIVIKLLAMCAENDKRYHLAADLLRQLPNADEVHLPLLASRVPDKELAQHLMSTSSFRGWTAAQLQARIDQAIQEGQPSTAVLAAVCANERDRAADIAVEELHKIFGYITPGLTGSWPVEQAALHARQLLDPVESLPLQDMQVKYIADILACASFVGLMEAKLYGYRELLFPLAQTLRNIIEHQSLRFPVTLAYIHYLEAEGWALFDYEKALRALGKALEMADKDANTPSEVRRLCEQKRAEYQAQLGSVPPLYAPDGHGLRKLPGANLPAVQRRHIKTSVMSNDYIRGPDFKLEDQKHYISLAEALAWVRVNVFSPLNTGCKIFPI